MQFYFTLVLHMLRVVQFNISFSHFNSFFQVRNMPQDLSQNQVIGVASRCVLKVNIVYTTWSLHTQPQLYVHTGFHRGKMNAQYETMFPLSHRGVGPTHHGAQPFVRGREHSTILYNNSPSWRSYNFILETFCVLIVFITTYKNFRYF